MSAPSYEILSDSEDESPNTSTIVILSDSDDEVTPPTAPNHSDEETEEDPEEGSDEEEEAEEESEPEEEPEPEPQHPHSPSPPIPVPDYDPYFPAPPPPVYPPVHHRSDARHWDWVPGVLGRWRRQEGNPFRRIGEPSQTEPHPVTGEPSHHTIPLLVARLIRQENQIEQLEDSVEILSGPEHVQELQQDVWSLEHHYQNLRDRTEQLNERIAADPNRLLEIERRIDGLEQNLERLNTLADSMRGYANYILKGDHVPK